MKYFLTLFLFFFSLSPVYAFTPQTHTTSLSATINPYIKITKIGEHNVNLDSNQTTPYIITTAFLPFTVIGFTQPQQKIQLTLSSSNTSQTFTTTSYQDGSFSFSVNQLNPNITYQITLTTITNLPQQAVVNFSLTYSPPTIQPTPAPIYYQIPLYKPAIALILIVCTLILISAYLFFVFIKNKHKIKILVINTNTQSPQPNIGLVVLANNQPIFTIITNTNGVAVFKPPSKPFSFTPPPGFTILNPSNLPLPDGYITYQNDTLYIKNHQLHHQNHTTPLSQLKAIVIFVKPTQHNRSGSE